MFSFLFDKKLIYFALIAILVVVLLVFLIKTKQLKYLGYLALFALIGVSIYSGIQIYYYKTVNGGIFGSLSGTENPNQVVQTNMTFDFKNIMLTETSELNVYEARFTTQNTSNLDGNQKYEVFVNSTPCSLELYSDDYIIASYTSQFYDEEFKEILTEPDKLTFKISFNKNITNLVVSTSGGSKAVDCWNDYFNKNDFILEIIPSDNVYIPSTMHALTLKVNDEIYKTIQILEGYSYILPTTLDYQIDGYVFQGWLNSSGELIKEITINSNTDINANLIKLHTVNFKLFKDDESIYSTLAIKDGDKISESDLPTLPENEYANAEIWFEGWNYNQEPILNNLTIYPNYSYLVTFVAKYQENDYFTTHAQIHILSGESIPADDIPNIKEEGYSLIGWILNGEEINPENIIVTEPIRIEAKLHRANYVQFVSDGIQLSYQWLENGEIATPPSNTPTKFGYIFDKWEKTEGLSLSTDEYKIYSDTVFTAVFKLSNGGIYTEDKKMIKDWITLTTDGSITVENNVITNLNLDSGNGYLVIPKDIEGIDLPELYGGNTTAGNGLKIIFEDGSMCSYIEGQLSQYVTLYSIDFGKNSKLTSLSKSVFAYSLITKINLSGTKIETIPQYAFANCENLETILLANLGPISTIENQAFRDCINLKTINLESVTEIDSEAFIGCSSLETITISYSETYGVINNCLIEKDTNTLVLGGKNAVIPTSVSIIGENAFYGRYSGTLIIPEGVIEIKENAFALNPNLEVINISSSVQSISFGLNKYSSHINSFYNCPNLTNITVDENNNYFKAENNCLIQISTNSIIKGISNVTIPATVSKIEAGAFDHTYNKNLIIPENITSIGNYAFSGSNIETCFLPNSLTEFGREIFTINSEIIFYTNFNSLDDIPYEALLNNTAFQYSNYFVFNTTLDEYKELVNKGGVK